MYFCTFLLIATVKWCSVQKLAHWHLPRKNAATMWKLCRSLVTLFFQVVQGKLKIFDLQPVNCLGMVWISLMYTSNWKEGTQGNYGILSCFKTPAFERWGKYVWHHHGLHISAYVPPCWLKCKIYTVTLFSSLVLKYASGFVFRVARRLARRFTIRNAKCRSIARAESLQMC